MPWKLESKNNEIVKYFLPNNLYIVGRTSADLIVIDKSVSRKHASLTWNGCQNYIDVQDFSKFGTYINKLKLKDKRGILQNGDLITFGAQPGVDYKCIFITFDLLTSTLISSDKIFLKKYISTIGGNILDNWNENIQYLVMSSLKVTYKVICALIKQVQIVNVNFIKDMLEYFRGSRIDQPNAEEYLPTPDSSDISNDQVSYKPDSSRQSLFKNKIFYFLSQQKLVRLEESIVSAGGKTVLLTSANSNDDTVSIQLANPDSLVMFESNPSDLVDMVYSILKTIKKRPIIDSEIGFAVLHVSTAEYCNPAKSCNQTIYSEVNLSQLFTTNPFHIDDPDLPPPKSTTGPLKRTYGLSLGLGSRPAKRMKSELINSNSTNGTVHQDKYLLNSKKSPSKTSNLVKKAQDRTTGLERREPISTVRTEDKENICNYLTTPSDLSTHKITKMRPAISESKRADSDDDFDNICVPSFGVLPANQNQVPAPTRILNDNRNQLSTNVSSTKHQVVKQAPASAIPYFSKHCQSIEMVPTEIIQKQSLVNDDYGTNRANIGAITRFTSLVKENYPGNRNFKLFKKVSAVFFNENVMEMFVVRK